VYTHIYSYRAIDMHIFTYIRMLHIPIGIPENISFLILKNILVH